ncbi:MAG: riboflavin synthase [Cardiobacteriaceae bacterium]|nr:riboflavin synthase [Cardiobacteriaceae bacterium]
MFTGIIETTGTVARLVPHGDDLTLHIQSDTFDFSTCQLGDSIAVNGVCLTAVELGRDYFTADVSVETLSLTTLGALQSGSAVNLERALTPATPLGGHLVSGHVDGIGELISRQTDARSTRMVFRAPPELSRYIAKKGSITVNGISLTVNDVAGDTFAVNIVPHTLERTTLGTIREGDAINLEADLIARYLERLIEGRAEGGLTLERLQQLGY